MLKPPVVPLGKGDGSWVLQTGGFAGRASALAAATAILCALTGGCQSFGRQAANVPTAAPPAKPTAAMGKNAGLQGLFSGSVATPGPNELLLDTDADPSFGDAPLAVRFTAAPFDPAEAKNPTYLWSFGDGSTETTEQNPTHTYDRAGSYTATVRVREAGGRFGTETFDISVYAPGK